MKYDNIYFVIGTSYAGKSTIVKNLAKKHNGIALEENYHDQKLEGLDPKEFPGLMQKRLEEAGFFAALDTEEGYVSFCVTEKRTREEVDQLVKIVKEG